VRAGPPGVIINISSVNGRQVGEGRRGHCAARRRGHSLAAARSNSQPRHPGLVRAGWRDALTQHELKSSHADLLNAIDAGPWHRGDRGSRSVPRVRQRQIH
jgi:hypothetical protein